MLVVGLPIQFSAPEIVTFFGRQRMASHPDSQDRAEFKLSRPARFVFSIFPCDGFAAYALAHIPNIGESGSANDYSFALSVTSGALLKSAR
jgi:hypothetical protein